MITNASKQVVELLAAGKSLTAKELIHTTGLRRTTIMSALYRMRDNQVWISHRTRPSGGGQFQNVWSLNVPQPHAARH